MSKKSRSKSKAKRRAMKSARKNAMRAKYEAFKNAGKNTKSKRFSLRSKKKKTISLNLHSLGKCGNVGCIKCFDINFNPFLEKGIPRRMPQRIYMKWVKTTEGARFVVARRLGLESLKRLDVQKALEEARRQ